MAEKKPTMAGLAVTPPAATSEEQGLKAIQDSYNKLNQLLGGIEGMDYDKMFGPYVEKIKGRPVSKAPGRAEAFARGFGSAGGAQSVMSQLETVRGEKEQREKDLMDAEKMILEAKMSQEMQKGQADRALKTLQATKELDFRLGEVKRKEDEAAFHRKQSFLFGEKGKLEGVKAGYAQKLIQDRARAIGKSLGFDEKMILKLIELTAQPLLLQLRSQFTFDPLIGPRLSDEEMEGMSNTVTTSILQTAQQLAAQLKGPQPAGTPTAPPAAAPGTGKSRVRIAWEKMQAEKGKK